jgi:hypothetical protein
LNLGERSVRGRKRTAASGILVSRKNHFSSLSSILEAFSPNEKP